MNKNKFVDLLVVIAISFFMLFTIIFFSDVNGYCSTLVKKNNTVFITPGYKRTTYTKVGVGKSNIYYAIIDKNIYPELVIANNRVGSVQDAEERAYQDKSDLTINAGIFNTKSFEPIGILVKNGKLLHNNDVTKTHGGRTWDVAALYMTASGELKSVLSVNVPTAKIMEKNPVWAVQGWYPIIVDGIDVSNRHSKYDYQPLTCIGQDYEGNYIVVVCEGRSLVSRGMSLPDMYDFVVNVIGFNAKFLYNLDGGGSSSFVYKGVRRNALTKNENRKVSTFISFRKKS